MECADVEVFRVAVCLIVRSMVLSAQSAGQQRLLLLQRAVTAGEAAGELTRLRDENRRLGFENRLLKARVADAASGKRYTLWRSHGRRTAPKPLSAVSPVGGACGVCQG
jgi:hypothetical protein